MSLVKRGIPRQPAHRVKTSRGLKDFASGPYKKGYRYQEFFGSAENITQPRHSFSRTDDLLLEFDQLPYVSNNSRPPYVVLRDKRKIPWNRPTAYKRVTGTQKFIEYDDYEYHDGKSQWLLSGVNVNVAPSRAASGRTVLPFGGTLYERGVRIAEGSSSGSIHTDRFNRRSQFVNSFQSHFNDGAELVVTALEIDKTFGMLADAVGSFTHVVRALKSGNANQLKLAVKPFNKRTNGSISTKLTSKDFASRWLEFQYGVKPLLADIEGTYTALQHLMRNYQLHRVRKSRVFDLDKTRTPPFDGAPPYYVIQRGQMSIQETHFYEWINDYALLANKLGLFNVAGAAWDIIPYSLVVDWFLPVGDMLKSYTTYWGTTRPAGASSCSNTLEIEYDTYSRWLGRSDLPFVHTSSCHVFYHERMVDVAWPKLDWYLKNPFSSYSRGVSALAMLRQLFH